MIGNLHSHDVDVRLLDHFTVAIPRTQLDTRVSRALLLLRRSKVREGTGVVWLQTTRVVEVAQCDVIERECAELERANAKDFDVRKIELQRVTLK